MSDTQFSGHKVRERVTSMDASAPDHIMINDREFSKSAVNNKHIQ